MHSTSAAMLLLLCVFVTCPIWTFSYSNIVHNYVNTINETCPDHSVCSDGTCCQTGQGIYGCCPLEDAVCCSDQKHCCSHGSTCDVSAGTCKHQEEGTSGMIVTESGLQELQVKHFEVEKVNAICPDHSQCNGTCCKVSSGYGCCPLSHAVCCSDQKHCCPEGSVCDTATSTCRRKEETADNGLLIIESGLQEIKIQNDVNQICPDHSQCNGTCCKTGTSYGCCPLPHAVCCADQKHCCPAGSTCDVATATCTRKEMTADDRPLIVQSGLQEIRIERDINQVCPDHSQCNGTCCKAGSRYGCCPLPHAVCCSDQKHCCPSGSTCDTATATCRRKETTADNTLLIVESAPQEIKMGNDVNQLCPDHSQCNGTCCKAGSRYGCCPLPHAVCCSDQKHCCPSGSTCDTATATCRRKETTADNTLLVVESAPQEIKMGNGDRSPAFSKLMMMLRHTNSNGICPDGSFCPGMCCRALYGYGCCPYSSATCCSDMLHCCPYGTVCDPSGTKCYGVNEVRDVGVASASIFADKSNKLCPDKSECNGTCCKVGDNYGCCPLANAQCCSDEIHCCPSGSVCDGATCRRREESRDQLVIVESPAYDIHLKNGTANQICPDHTVCSGGTCCDTEQGYGCCPFENAVCCSDQEHCCPQGKRCDVATASCKPQNDIFAFMPLGSSTNRLKGFEPKNGKANNVCPGGSMQCSGDETCCPSDSAGWNCCAYKNAICCHDGSHCCPEGTVCDEQHDRCIYNRSLDSQYDLMASKLSYSSNSFAGINKDDVVCPGGESCPHGSTCCLQETGGYGCCRYKNGVCCADKMHCCPSDNQCDEQHEQCVHKSGIIDIMKMNEASPDPLAVDLVSPTNISIGQVCPGMNAYCPVGEMSCCPGIHNQYDCCPFRNAVCCSDQKHCCPSGMECDTDTGMCQEAKKSEIHWVSLINALPYLKSDASDVCPDNSTQCTNNQTCCQDPDTKSYYCCLYAGGSCCTHLRKCCSPNHHCTPKGICRKKH